MNSLLMVSGERVRGRVNMHNQGRRIQTDIDTLRPVLKKPCAVGLIRIIAIDESQNLDVADAFTRTAKLSIAQGMEFPFTSSTSESQP